ncbi:MAG: 3-deoxy-manno-octulosonate cytidylyltransferase [Candidatus Omnitrophica bacterium]|nr:3-deoxy-manno-octulosonate cytidylyltransferase [Candidatus Omnitrophota bacterium]
MKVSAIIPARMASSRFPGKPLKSILGLPMVEHVRRRVLLSRSIDEVIVATCDQEIFEAIKRFGGKAVMTAETHQSCVDRVAEAAKNLDADIILNVQGDMPLLNPGSLDQLVAPFLNDDQVLFTDMIGPLTIEEEFYSPNVVKVVVDLKWDALFYSREPIPSLKKVSPKEKVSRYKQFGINAYRRDSLELFTRWERTPLERAESIDMLRILEHGVHIRTVVSLDSVVGVDTPEDLIRVEDIMRLDPVYLNYRKE